MLVNGSVRYGGGPGRIFGALGSGIDRARWTTPGALRNFYAGEGTIISGVSIANRSAIPNGYVHPYSWVMAIKAGGMATAFNVHGTATTIASIAGGRNVETVGGGITTTSTITAAGGLTVPLDALVPGTGVISTANVEGFLGAASTVTTSGTVSTADLGALAGGVSTITGTGSCVVTTGSTAGSMAASIVVTYSATVDASELAGLIWEYALEGSYTAADIQRLVAAALAGKASGSPGSPVFRNLQDTEDRISGTTDAYGNRSAVTLNP